jgi:hypothetical protein
MNTQRALWTFLIFALVAPFFGALTIAAVVILAPLLGLGDLLPADVPPLGIVALSSFVWAIVPAVLAGIALAVIVLRQGSVGWIVAAAVGVVAFAIAAVIFPAPELAPLRPYLAFLAGLVAVVLREMLARAKIIAP